MSITWDDILNNREQYADSLELDVNGTKMSVGEARARLLPKGEYTKATQRARELETQLAQAVQAQAQMQQQFQQELARRGQSAPTSQDEVDALVSEYPGLAPIANRLKRYEQQMAEAAQRIQQHELVFNTNQHAAMYNQIKEKDAEFASDEGRSKLINYALQHGIQRLDLAHQLLTRDRDAQKAAEAARQEGIAEGKKLAKQPTILGGGSRTASKSAPVTPTDFRSAEAAALADPEILSIMNGESAA